MLRRWWLCIALLYPAEAAGAGATVGLGRAKDGDSLMVANTEVRLFGIDAPEFDQICRRGSDNWACGSEAAERLAALVTGKEVHCRSMGVDQHGRMLGRCTVGLTDINRSMVAAGLAVAYRRYSMDYVTAEAAAKASKRGIWAGTFAMPSDYRREGAAAAEPPADRPRRALSSGEARVDRPAPSGGCVIKGNKGSNGWIYHVPGMPYYVQTRAEQMFCSEAEARAAGYRRARVR